MKLYKSPLDMFGLSLDEWKSQPEKLKAQRWKAFEDHVKARGLAGLLKAYQEHIKEGTLMR